MIQKDDEITMPNSDAATTSEPIALPGARDVRGSLDFAPEDLRDNTSAGTGGDFATTERSEGTRDRPVVVACPPHPQYGGSRSDPRLLAVSDRLTARGVDCLRFDYGPWDDGTGERTDARAALAWAEDRYARVGLFGYSFGGAVAILVAAGRDEDSPGTIDALCALSPARKLADGATVPEGIPDVRTSATLVYGSRDETVEFEPTVEAARRAGWRVTELAADHQFTGMRSEAASAVADGIVPSLA